MSCNPARSAKPRTTATPPWLTDPLGWITVQEFAVRWKRSPITIRKWCQDGTLVENGFIVHQDAKQRWYIKVPANG